jgi:hypothetical protein
MLGVKIRIMAGVLVAALCWPPAPASAGSLGDFFKAVGNSIAHPGQKPKPKAPPPRRPKTKAAQQVAEYPPTPPPVAPSTASPTPAPTTSQPPVRPASAPPQDRNSKRDIPYAIPVPNKPGFVTSPFAPKSGYVDVRGFPSGTEVKDPYSGKTFLTP